MGRINAGAIPSNQSVNVDSAQGIVSFTLRPNQTFSSYAMRVLEGRVKPVTIEHPDSAAANPLPPGAAETAAPKNALPVADSKPEPKEGLSGLINRYEQMQGQQ